jgi:hypothetical protein
VGGWEVSDIESNYKELWHDDDNLNTIFKPYCTTTTSSLSLSLCWTWFLGLARMFLVAGGNCTGKTAAARNAGIL